MTLLHPDKRVALFAARFESESTPGLTYDVALWPDGRWTCECWPWLKEHRCAHVAKAAGWLRKVAR
jgi:hypothetical protein